MAHLRVWFLTFGRSGNAGQIIFELQQVWMVTLDHFHQKMHQIQVTTDRLCVGELEGKEGWGGREREGGTERERERDQLVGHVRYFCFQLTKFGGIFGSEQCCRLDAVKIFVRKTICTA